VLCRGSQGTRTDAGSTFLGRILTASENCWRPVRRVLDVLSATRIAQRQCRHPPSRMPT
jgi:hypothetical protein